MIININKSYCAGYLVVGLHAGAAILIALVPLSIGLKTALFTLVAASLYRQWRTVSRAWPCAATLDDHGYWQFRSGHERHRVVAASRDAFAIRLMLEDGNGRRHPRLLMRDALDAGTYHALCSRIAQRRLPSVRSATDGVPV